MDNELKHSLSRSETWIRGLYMLLFYVIFSIAELVLALVVFFQFILMLITGRTNDRLLEFGDDLSVFIYQILQFLTFNTEEKPFPFSPWPIGADVVTTDELAGEDAVEDAASSDDMASADVVPEPLDEVIEPSAEADSDQAEDKPKSGL